MTAPISASMGTTTATNTAGTTCKKMSAEDIKKVPQKIEETGKAINDSLDTINDTMKRTTESVGGIGITCAGLFTTLKKPFVGMFNWLKEAKLNPETGEEILDKAGNVVKQWNKSKLIGLGITLAAVTTAIVIAKCTHKKPEVAQQPAQQVAQTEPKQEEHKLDVVSEA